MTTLETTYRAATTPFLSHSAVFGLENSPLVKWPLQKDQNAAVQSEMVQSEIRVRARVSDEVAPFAWVDDEPDVQDEIMLPRPKSTPVNVVIVSREAPPFVFQDEFEGEDEGEDEGDWIDIQAQPLLPPKARFPVVIEIERTVRPPVLPLEIDDVDLELFDL